MKSASSYFYYADRKNIPQFSQLLLLCFGSICLGWSSYWELMVLGLNVFFLQSQLKVIEKLTFISYKTLVNHYQIEKCFKLFLLCWQKNIPQFSQLLLLCFGCTCLGSSSCWKWLDFMTGFFLQRKSKVFEMSTFIWKTSELKSASSYSYYLDRKIILQFSQLLLLCFGSTCLG